MNEVMSLNRNDPLMAASICRMRNANLDIAVQPIQKPKQSLYTKTAKITVL